VVVPADFRESWPFVESLAGDGFLHPALGLHPWRACAPDIPDLRARLLGCGAVAVGEIGLDGAVDVPVEIQLACFEPQLDLALELGLPVLLHCRKSFDLLESVLARRRVQVPGILHAFSRTPGTALRFMRLGLHVAFGGAVTRPGARRTRESAAELPLERIVLETDAPAIGMHGLPPEMVEPAHVAMVAEAVAELRGLTPADVAAATSAAARRLLGLG
jgi:TatD DNase family protein